MMSVYLYTIQPTKREVYELCSPGYRGRCTAPVMVDKKTRRIVNNESSDIIRMLNLMDPPQSTG